MAISATTGRRVLLSAFTFAALTGCAPGESARGADPSPAPAPIPATPAVTAPDPATVGANELGLIPVLMYHQLTAEPVSEYDQTPEEFRAELDRLYREGYRPVTAAEYISGRIDLPAGTHPVVLTFDDSTISQLRFADNGRPAPDSAVGILEEFHATHPDFRATATFYVNNQPFGNDRRALPWLARHGYDIGAHTANHADLGQLDSVGVQREFVENLRAIEVSVPSATVRTMALPLGIFPADRALSRIGSWDGRGYTFAAVMLVGAEPAPSPFGWIDPAGIPRIRSARERVPFDSDDWLDRLAADPARRYTSDGDPQRISFPKSAAATLDPRWSNRANPF